MQKKTFYAEIAAGILDHIRRDSFQKEAKLQVAHVAPQRASETLEVFREANPEWPMTFSWTFTGKEKAMPEANLWEAIRRRDRCRGAYDLSMCFRQIIERASGSRHGSNFLIS